MHEDTFNTFQCLKLDHKFTDPGIFLRLSQLLTTAVHCVVEEGNKN